MRRTCKARSGLHTADGFAGLECWAGTCKIARESLMFKRRWNRGLFLVLALVPAAAFASPGAGHGDPVASVVLALTVILVAAKLGGELAVRVGQSAVLGELVVGVLLGNLTLVGYSGLDYLLTDSSVDMLARIGVLVLLFEVGLESTVGQMLKVGLSSLLVATLGVITPFALD